MKKYAKYLIVLLLIIFLDQASKLWIYSYLESKPGDHIKILGNLFKLTYMLNYGMAFGLQLGFKYGKLLITIIRLAASLYIAVHIVRSLLQSTLPNSIWGWVFVLGGAVGNAIDSIFYGVYLNNAPDHAPMKWFHGQVIDMLHLDLWSGFIPDWVPIYGGQEIYLLPIFNIADLAIFFGLAFILYSFNASTALKKNNQVKDLIV